MLNTKELRKTKLKDLAKKAQDLDKEIALEIFNISTKKSNKTAQLRAMRKDYARIQTVINEHKVIENSKNK